MILDYCELSLLPAFQYNVAELTTVLGDRATHEALRDYLEYRGVLREPEQIIAKLRNDDFSIVPQYTEAQIEKLADAEIVMTNAAKFKELGISVPKKQISNQQVINLRQTISKVNNELAKKGINRVYRLPQPVQVGQSDNYTWEVKVFKGNLDTKAKAERLSSQDLISNRVPRLITQGTSQLQLDLQNNIRTALLGINSNTNGNNNDRSANSKFNSKVLRESIERELSDSSKISFGKLQQSDTDMVFHPNPGGNKINNFERISGKTFQEIFSSDGYDIETQKLYIASRFFESLYTNKVNRELERLLFGKVRQSDKGANFRTTEGTPLNNILFSYGDSIYLNLYKDDLVSFFKELYKQGVNLDEFVDIAIFEELIHTAVTKLIPSKILWEAMVELADNNSLNEKISYYYSLGGVSFSKKINSDQNVQNLNVLSNELIRILVQKNVLGITTEDIKHRGSAITSVMNQIWEFLKDLFGSSKIPQHKKIADQITAFIKEGESIDSSTLGDIPLNLSNIISQSNYSQQIIRKMAEVMSEQVGVDVLFVTPDQAEEITKNSTNPWKGQKSFFFNGKAYFIAGSLTPSDVLHEFVHPIIKNIAGANKPLFKALFTKLKTTQEGQKIIEDVIALYPDLDINSDDFKEETLVRAIEKMHDLNNKGLEKTSAFEKFVNDLLYNIKQWLRSIFGQKIKVSDLSPNTTLEELSDILKEGGKFELDAEIITDKDIVAYKNSYNQFMQDVVAEKIDKKELVDLANKTFEAANKYIYNARKQNDLGKLADVLYNEYRTGDLEKVTNNLRSYQDQILSEAKTMEDDIELTRQRTEAIINSLGYVDNSVSKIKEGLKELVRDIDNRDNIQRVQYFQEYLNYWGNFAKDARRILERNGVTVNFIDNTISNVDRANELVEKFYEEAAKDTLEGILGATAQNIDKKWEERITELKAKNKPQSVIDEAEKQYKKEKLTPDIIEKALKGQLKDIGYISYYLEAAGYSSDPVFGGLALFIKNSLTETEIIVQKKFNEYALKVKPLLDQYGYNPNTPGKIGEDIGVREKVGKVNPDTEEFEEREVWRFRNQFTGADIVRDKFLYDIKKAREQYEQTGSDEDKQKLADLQSDHEQHNRDFYNTKYTEEFYKAYDILKNDPIGNEAKMIINDLYDDLNRLEGNLYTAGVESSIEITELIESKRREIRQVSSLYDLVGELKTGKDLEIAVRLQKFNESIKNIYTSVEVPNAFKNAYQQYEQKLKDDKKTPSDAAIWLQKWIDQNTRSSVTDEFWEEFNRILADIKDIMADVPDQGNNADILEENYKVLRDMVKGSRDESGQPLGSELSPEKQEKIKQAQEAINKVREQVTGQNNLTRAEEVEIQTILAKLRVGQNLDRRDSVRLSQLLTQQKGLPLSLVKSGKLKSLFVELDDLRVKEPTDSYVDSVNALLDGMNSEVVSDILTSLNLNKNSIGVLNNLTTAQRLMDASSEFEEWFLRNHTKKEIFDQKINQKTEIWERTYAWNVIKPRDSKYYGTTTIKNLAGETIQIQALPSLKYYKRIVKDEYITPKIVGVTVGNRGLNDWLPKTMEQGAKDSRYIDKEYIRLKSSNSTKYQLLEMLKKEHLANQEGLAFKDRLGLDYPRMSKDFVERVQSDKPYNMLIQRAKQFWQGAKDNWDAGFNADTEANLVKLDLFDNESSKIPISGLYDLPISEVSTDIVTTSLRYMLSAEKNKQLNKIAPVAKMIQNVVNKHENYPAEQKMIGNRSLYFPNQKKDRYLRAKAVNNLIEKTFEGKENVGFGSDSALAQNFSNFIFKRAASTFIGLNYPSALKNQLSMKFQGMVEALAGQHFTTKDFVAAEVDATNTTMAVAMETYKQGPKSLNIQLMEIIDPERDRFANQFRQGTGLSRGAVKDYTFNILDRFNDFRSMAQLQAGLQIMFAMMRHDIITTKDGKKIMFKDAWQVKDGKIQLKDNVPAEWGITYDSDGNQIIGEKFKQTRLRYQRVLDNLNGAMSKSDRPESDRYLAWRYISFFRRFLTSQLANRFAKNRHDFQLMDTKEGFYRTFLKLMYDTVKNMGRNLTNLNAAEKAASLRMLGDVGFTMILKYLVLGTILGFNDDDDDRFKKLRANSDSLPFPGAFDDPSRAFDLMGWLENHAILMTMQVGAENSQFIFPSNYKQYLDVKSIAFGPTLNAAFDLISDAYNIASGDEKAIYQRAAGSYGWNQEGSYKIWNHLGKAVGFTSSTIAPDLAARNFSNIQNR